MSTDTRIAITGMSINTPLGDTLDGFLAALLAGRSAVSRWRSFDTSRIYCKVGGDLTDYDVATAVAAVAEESDVPAETAARLRVICRRAPWSTSLSCLAALQAFRDARLFDDGPDPYDTAAIIAGHNLNQRYVFDNHTQFEEEPDWIDGLMSLHALDTDHAGSVSEVLNLRGPLYTVGGACASGNAALRCAVDEIRHHAMEVALVVGAVVDFALIDLHAMALMGAITTSSFNDDPHHASRPFDTRREGFVPSHGSAAMVLEPWDRAMARGAHIHAELLGVEASGDANHLPSPSEEGQSRLMQRLLHRCGVAPQEVDYINAHATSTVLGDLTEIRSLRRVFGDHARQLKINATKSMLGHTCWAAPVVETVAAVLQMEAGRLHASVNVDELDPEIDLDVCASGPVDHQAHTVLKNSFGFGGINAISLLRSAS